MFSTTRFLLFMKHEYRIEVIVSGVSVQSSAQ